MDQVPPDRRQVWDLPLRLFHWALVVLVAFQAYTGLWGGPSAMVWHGRAGMAILALALFRIVWGFVGGRHARFADFVRGPAAIVKYLQGGSADHAGHNPLSALSVIALLAVLLTQAGTGLFAHDDILFEGPLFNHVGKETSDALTGYHYLSSRALLVLVVLHLGAIAIYRLKGNDLIRPMVTGWRKGGQAAGGAVPEETTVPVVGSAVKALVVLALSAAVVVGIVNL
jgi:cytochrome b